MTTEKPDFLRLCEVPELDDEVAYTICRMIDVVGYKIHTNWDWNWLRNKKESYQSLIDYPLARAAWILLLRSDWLRLQTTDNETRRTSTITSLAGLKQLRCLMLQNNLVASLHPIAGLGNLKRIRIAKPG